MSVRRGVTTSRLAHGGTSEVTIDLRNDARWEPAPLLLVEDRCHWTLAEQPRFVVSGVRPREVVRLSYPIRGGHRGRYTVGPLQLRVRDPFGAVEQVRRYTGTDEVIVHPRVEALPSGLTRGTHLGSGSSDERRLYNAGDEFHTMREYVQGDDLRLVHWPSTAKQNTLMVRQQELPWQAEATVLLDTRGLAHRGAGPDSTFEKAVSAAASVVWHLAGHGYRLRLTTDSDRQPPPVESWAELLDRGQRRRQARDIARRGDTRADAAVHGWRSHPAIDWAEASHDGYAPIADLYDWVVPYRERPDVAFEVLDIGRIDFIIANSQWLILKMTGTGHHCHSAIALGKIRQAITDLDSD